MQLYTYGVLVCLYDFKGVCVRSGVCMCLCVFSTFVCVCEFNVFVCGECFQRVCVDKK